MRTPFMGALALALSLPVQAQAEAPFARPLHIQRIVHDPISQTTSAIDEYYVGHQVVAVRGNRVVIVDHHKRTITEIDRERSSWSESALSPKTPPRRVPELRERRLDADGTIHLQLADHDIAAISVDVDRSVPLTRAAVGLLVNEAGSSRDTFVTQAAGTNGEGWFLPTRIERRFVVAGEEIWAVEELRFVAWEAPPAELLRLPQGANREMSRSDRLEQVLVDIEEPRQ